MEIILTKNMLIVFQGALLLLLAILLLKYRLRILGLEKNLAEEKRKRLLPFLELEVDTENVGAYLCNDSYCYAKDIQIADADFVADFGYKKSLRLKFETIDVLKPGEKKPLRFRVFDREYDITDPSSVGLVLQFEHQNLKIHLHYKNIENQEFISTIISQQGKFFTIESKPTSQPDQQD